MKIYTPCYYAEFECIKDKCRHNCCIGWEIDIDDDTYEYYKTVEGELGEALKKNISSDGGAHFLLGENDRCPFLNEKGLCEIIIGLGEDKLCEICKKHPRFMNFFSDRVEVGLGLCCEEAARIILTRKEKTETVIASDDGAVEILEDEEDIFFGYRDEFFEIIKNRDIYIEDRIKELLKRTDIIFPDKSIKEWADIYSGLEVLDGKWLDLLNELKRFKCEEKEIFKSEEWETAFEQLLIYFMYRHIADGMYDGRIKERIGFCVLSCKIIRSLCIMHYEKHSSVTIDAFLEYARFYSSEIEYSEENTDFLIDIFCEDDGGK